MAAFANDLALRDTLYQLGFGAFLIERLRDLSAVDAAPGVEVVEERDFQTIAGIDADHRRYYRGSPIFLMKDDSPAAVRSALAAHQDRGDALFVYRQDGRSKGYFVVGHCAGKNQGFLLQGSGTAQVLSAYAEPEVRGRGVGRALLGACVQWASRQGCSRLLVEHETANLSGSRFWQRHFDPYLCFSTRYVEDCG
jgi:GNAT superfamily N-acetyltransferase